MSSAVRQPAGGKLAHAFTGVALDREDVRTELGRHVGRCRATLAPATEEVGPANHQHPAEREQEDHHKSLLALIRASTIASRAR